MAEITLKAETGRKIGDGPSKRLRAAGRIPATVYGLGKDPASISVNWRELRATLITDAGVNVIIDLEVDGEVDLVQIKEIQRHPVRRDVLHVDFLRLDRDAKATADVPFSFEGEAKAVFAENGILNFALNSLTIEAKPADIPDSIVVDVSDLTVDGQIRVGDLTLPAGVTTSVDPDELVVAGAAGDIAPAEDAEGEGAEGDAAEGAEG